MAETINLATKEMQDSIKNDTSQISSKSSQSSVNSIRSDTQYIRNQFPINSGIKSVQRGLYTYSNMQKEVSISSVNINKSFLIFTNKSSTGSTVNGNIKNSTTLIFDSAGNNDIEWQVIEFE